MPHTRKYEKSIMHHYQLVFSLCLTASDSLHVTVSEEELTFPVSWSHVQWCASGETSFPPQDSNWVCYISILKTGFNFYLEIMRHILYINTSNTEKY